MQGQGSGNSEVGGSSNPISSAASTAPATINCGVVENNEIDWGDDAPVIITSTGEETSELPSSARGIGSVGGEEGVLSASCIDGIDWGDMEGDAGSACKGAVGQADDKAHATADVGIDWVS